MKSTFLSFTIACVSSIVFPMGAAADEGDDTLRMYLSKSDVVVVGEVLTEPFGTSSEAGVVELSFEFRVADVLKGKAQEDRDIEVAMKRFELMPGDELPWLKKGAKAILFLRIPEPGKGMGADPVSADMWFGIQPANWKMQKSLKRLEAEANPND